MGKARVMEENESEIEVSESPLKEEDATSIVKKKTPPPVKEYVPWLPYPSQLKSDHTDEKFKWFSD